LSSSSRVTSRTAGTNHTEIWVLNTQESAMPLLSSCYEKGVGSLPPRATSCAIITRHAARCLKKGRGFSFFCRFAVQVATGGTELAENDCIDFRPLGFNRSVAAPRSSRAHGNPKGTDELRTSVAPPRRSRARGDLKRVGAPVVGALIRAPSFQ
jgi:hypothetical protein